MISSHLCVFFSFLHGAHYGLDLVNCVWHCAANLFHIKLESMGGFKILAFSRGMTGVGYIFKGGKKTNQFLFLKVSKTIPRSLIIIY